MIDAKDEVFEEVPGTGFWIALDGHRGPARLIEVSEATYRRHRGPVAAGNPHGEPKVITAFELFPKDKI